MLAILNPHSPLRPPPCSPKNRPSSLHSRCPSLQCPRNRGRRSDDYAATRGDDGDGDTTRQRRGDATTARRRRRRRTRAVNRVRPHHPRAAHAECHPKFYPRAVLPQMLPQSRVTPNYPRAAPNVTPEPRYPKCYPRRVTQNVSPEPPPMLPQSRVAPNGTPESRCPKCYARVRLRESCSPWPSEGVVDSQQLTGRPVPAQPRYPPMLPRRATTTMRRRSRALMSRRVRIPVRIGEG